MNHQKSYLDQPVYEGQPIDEEWVALIKEAKSLGMTLEEIEKFLGVTKSSN